MIRTRKARAALLAALLPLGACAALRTPYAPPVANAPAAWSHTGADLAGAPQGDWWRRFGDDKLDQLVDRVLARDNDLAAAAITLRRARLQARYAVINPVVSGGVSYNDTVPLTNTTTTVTVGGYTFQTGSNSGAQSINPAIQASYELDLFDTLGAQKDVAKWEARATEQDLASARLSLIGQTIDDYYELAYLNGEIARTGQDIAYAQSVLDLVRVQVRAGDLSSLDESLAAQSLAAAQADLHALTEQRVEARNSLSLLLNGETASPDDELPALPDADPPPVDPGLPASLLGRRPDLRAAEMRLREQLAGLDQARLSLYPTLTLNGSLGTSSARLADLLQNPVGTLGADLTLPWLNYSQAKLNVGVSRADYDLAAVNFRQTLYKALVDVDNALSQREQYAGQAADLGRALDETRALERLDSVRYHAGAVPLKALLDDQEARRQAESALAQTRFNQLQTYVALCKALGGDARVSAQ